MESFPLFTGGEGKGEEGRRTARPHRAHVGFHDGQSTLVARFAKALHDLHRAVGVSLEELPDGALVGVELAPTRDGTSRAEVGLGEPGGDGSRVERERTRDLGDGEPLVVVEVADTAERLVIDHCKLPGGGTQNGGSSSGHSGCCRSSPGW